MSARRNSDDSGYLQSDSQSTISLTSSDEEVYQRRVLANRIFNTAGGHPYLMPIDQAAEYVQKLTHMCIVDALAGRLCETVSPLDPPMQVLDLGTWPCEWAFAFADKYPSSHVIGLDLTLQSLMDVPVNATLQRGDMEDDWNFSRPLNYIFVRQMAGSIENWPRLLGQSYRNLQAEGKIEIQDFDLHLTHSNPDEQREWTKLYKILVEGYAKLGRPIDTQHSIATWLAGAGFSDTRMQSHSIAFSGDCENTFAMGTFMKLLPDLLLLCCVSGLNWSMEKYEEYMKDVRYRLWYRSSTLSTALYSFTATKDH